MILLWLIVIIIILLSSVAAWSNTKMILEDLTKIKKALQIRDEGDVLANEEIEKEAEETKGKEEQ